MKLHETFERMINQVVADSAGNQEWEVEVGDLIQSFTGGRKIGTGDGEVVLSDRGLRQLSARLDIPYPFLLALTESPGLQQEVMAFAAERKDITDTMVTLHIDGGTEVSSIVSRDYFLAKNTWILMSMHHMMFSGDMPDDFQVHQFHVSDHGRVLRARFVSPSINYNIGTGKNQDPGYAGLWLANDEHGTRAFSAGVQFARVSCFNSVTSQSLFGVNHRFADEHKFIEAMRQAVGLMRGYGESMADKLRGYRKIKLDNPVLVLEEAIRRAKMPGYAADAARSFFTNSTGGVSVFDVVSGITWGSQLLADPPGKFKPRMDTSISIDNFVIDGVAEVIKDKGETAFVMTVGDLRRELEDVPDYARLDEHYEVAQYQVEDEQVVTVKPQ